MTQFPISDSPGRMGRPSLNVKPTVVRLEVRVLERIDELLGPNQRARFIREAVDREIKRLERLESNKASGNSQSEDSSS